MLPLSPIQVVLKKLKCRLYASVGFEREVVNLCFKEPQMPFLQYKLKTPKPQQPQEI